MHGNITKVTVVTIDQDDLNQGGSACKFYRAYCLEHFTVFQYGSMRTGKRLGTFKVAGQGNAARALAAAHKQIATKEAEGYEHRETALFYVDLDKFCEVMGKQGDKGAGAWLENMFDAARVSGGVSNVSTTPGAPLATSAPRKAKASPAVPSSPPAAPRISGDRLEVLVQRALSAISLAASNPAQALTEYSLVTKEVDEIDVMFRKARSYLNTLETLIEEEM